MTSRQTVMLVGAATVLAILGGFYWKGRLDGVAHERPALEAVQGRAAIAALEVEGARKSAGQVGAAAIRRDAAAAVVAKLTTQTLKSEAVHAPLDSARADRLRSSDCELCRTAPELAGCPAH